MLVGNCKKTTSLKKGISKQNRNSPLSVENDEFRRIVPFLNCATLMYIDFANRLPSIPLDRKNCLGNTNLHRKYLDPADNDLLQ